MRSFLAFPTVATSIAFSGSLIFLSLFSVSKTRSVFILSARTCFEDLFTRDYRMRHLHFGLPPEPRPHHMIKQSSFFIFILDISRPVMNYIVLLDLFKLIYFQVKPSKGFCRTCVLKLTVIHAI